jgi:hypothetical protein
MLMTDPIGHSFQSISRMSNCASTRDKGDMGKYIQVLIVDLVGMTRSNDDTAFMTSSYSKQTNKFKRYFFIVISFHYNYIMF